MFICMTIAGLGTKTCVCVRGRGVQPPSADGLVTEVVLPGELVRRRFGMKKYLCSELEGYARKL